MIPPPKDQIKIKRNITCLYENQKKEAKDCKKKTFVSFKFIIFVSQKVSAMFGGCIILIESVLSSFIVQRENICGA
ncbi:hypothetical protein BpHYR1_025690 [Brachionus plicatilis]|uniref:Uncharacterized protein n=1 Tax=Brachionus plicatilis TaxID=10195 RepID=A0A3M7SH94_BRAPC|nr:hypothetical protein BpHYR1_025690 [Brachionus plicatilis]